jgi:hypothetical protein
LSKRPACAYDKELKLMRNAGIVAMVVAAVIVSCAGLWASPSGINNIPTADITPLGKLVLQAYTHSDEGERTTATLGAKYGLPYDIEVGADKRLLPNDPDGPTTLSVKKAFALGLTGSRFAVGVANITDNTGDHPIYPYGVFSQPLAPRSRGHLGFAAQRDNNEVFVGYDFTLPRGTMLCADVVRGLSGGDKHTLCSVGALMPAKFGAVEGWVTRHTLSGADSGTSLTLKVDYNFPR